MWIVVNMIEDDRWILLMNCLWSCCLFVLARLCTCEWSLFFCKRCAHFSTHCRFLWAHQKNKGVRIEVLHVAVINANIFNFSPEAVACLFLLLLMVIISYTQISWNTDGFIQHHFNNVMYCDIRNVFYICTIHGPDCFSFLLLCFGPAAHTEQSESIHTHLHSVDANSLK